MDQKPATSSGYSRNLKMPQLIPATLPLPTTSSIWAGSSESSLQQTTTTRSPVIVKNYTLDSIAMELQAKKMQTSVGEQKPGVIDLNSLDIHPFIDAGVSSEFGQEGVKLRYRIRCLADGASGLRERVEKKAQSNPCLLDAYDHLENRVTDFFNRVSRETRLSGDKNLLKYLREITAINTRIPVDVETTTRPPVTSRVNSKPLFKPEIQFCQAFWSFLEGKEATGYILNEVTLAHLQKNQDDLSFLNQPSPCVLYGREDNPTIANNRARGKVVKAKNGHLTVIFEPLPPVRKRVENEERLSKFRAPTSFYYFVANIGNYWFLCPPFRILVHMNKQNVIQRQKLEIAAADGQQKVVEMSGRHFAVGAFLMTEQLPPKTATPLFHGQFSENLRKCIKGSGNLRRSGLDVLDGLDFQMQLETGRGFSQAAQNCWKEHILPAKPIGVSSLWEQYSLACVAGTLHTPEELFWNAVNSLKQHEQIFKAWNEGLIPGPLCSFCISEMLRRIPCEAQLVSFHLESGHHDMIVYYKQKGSNCVQQKGPFAPYELLSVLTEIRELMLIRQIVDWKGDLQDKERILKVLTTFEESHDKSGTAMHSRETLKRQFSESVYNSGRLRSIHDALPDKMQELTVQDMTRTFLAREHMNDSLSLRLLQVLKRLEECMKFQRILHISSYHGTNDYWKRLHQEWMQQLGQVDNEFEWLTTSLKEAIEQTEETSQFRADLSRHLDRLRKCSMIFLSQPPPRIIRRANVKVVAHKIANTASVSGEGVCAKVRLLGRTALWGDLLMSGIEHVEATVLTEERVQDIIEKAAPFPENTIRGKISIDEHMMSASFPLAEIERLCSECPMKSVFGGPQRHYYVLAKAQQCQALSLPFLFLLPYLKKQRDGDRFLFGTLMFCETLPPPRLPISCATSPSLAMQERIMACANRVPVARVVDVLDILFRCYTNVTRRLNETCRNHIYNRLLSLLRDNKNETDISWRQFALDQLPNKYRDSAFSFEEWFFDCANTVRSNEGIQKFWNEGHILGFMPKEDVLPILVKSGKETMYLKFSDSVPGGVLLIALNNGPGADYFHMSEAQYLLSALPKIAREPIKGTKQRDPIKKILSWSENGQIAAKPFDPDTFAKGVDGAPTMKARRSEHPYSRTLEPDITNCEELIEYSTKIWAQYRTYLEGYLNRESQKPEKREELKEKLESVTKILTEHQQEIEKLLNDSMNKMGCSDSGISTMDSESLEGSIAQGRIPKTEEDSDDGSSSSTEYCPKSSGEEDNTVLSCLMDTKEEPIGIILKLRDTFSQLDEAEDIKSFD